MRKMLSLLVLGALICGCAATMPWSIEKSRNNLMKLEVGMSKQEVVDIMGNPYNREAYTTAEGKVLDFLIYLLRQ